MLFRIDGYSCGLQNFHITNIAVYSFDLRISVSTEYAHDPALRNFTLSHCATYISVKRKATSVKFLSQNEPHRKDK